MKKKIEIAPYDASWPNLFEQEAKLVQMHLSSVNIHHVGSTSVPGLCAKPRIDIIAVIKEDQECIKPLEQCGYQYKGEWNIPFKFGFTKRIPCKVNLHVYEEEHAEIALNLFFRDRLCENEALKNEYADLKERLLQDPCSFYKEKGSRFTRYNLQKGLFISGVLKDFKELRFLKCTHYHEWENYHRIKKERIFDPLSLSYNKQHPSISDSSHEHFVLCEGIEVVGISHIEFLDTRTAVLRSIATDLPHEKKGYGKKLLQLTEKWLKRKGIEIIKLHANPNALGFYKKLDYQEGVWEDISINPDAITLIKRV